MELLLLDKEEIRGLLDIDGLMDALTAGFIALSGGTVQAPKRSEIDVPGAGHLLIKPAWIPGSAMTVKLVSTYLGNGERRLPAIQGLICLFDSANGTPLAIMDASYITAARTAACSALSARLMARKNACTLAILGAGIQGLAHLEVFTHIGSFNRVRLASLNFGDAQKLATMVPEAQAFDSYREAVNGADVVCLCTSANKPVIELDWLSPGAHVTSVGFSVPGGELSQEIIRNGRLIVETRLSFEAPPVGCGELAGLDPALGTELGELLSGIAPGRKSDGELTVFKSMGHAMEDLVAADLVYKKALEKGMGRHARL